jgi:hypothetical protein
MIQCFFAGNMAGGTPDLEMSPRDLEDLAWRIAEARDQFTGLLRALLDAHGGQDEPGGGAGGGEPRYPYPSSGPRSFAVPDTTNASDTD